MTNVYKKPSLHQRRDITMQSLGRRILFTGPDGIGDYKPRTVNFPWYIGESPKPQGETGDLSYIWRPAPGTPPPQAKQCYVGAVGWGLQHSWAMNRSTVQSNKQIKLGEFRTALEERMIYSYHNPCYVHQPPLVWRSVAAGEHKRQPPPSVMDRLSAGARGRLAWDHDINSQHFHEQYKQSLLNKNKPDQNTAEDASQSSGSNILDIDQKHRRVSE